jgi:predicted RNA-binding protein YlqC (UPF0109 family)
MSDIEVEEEVKAQTEITQEEKAPKRTLPKLDNVDDDLPGDRAAALIEHVVMSLVEHKDKAEIEVVENADESVELHVHVDDDEIGRVIGKKGRVIQAMRKLARAVGSAEDTQVGVEVVDPNRPSRNERSDNY